MVLSSGMGAPFAVDFGTAYKLAPSLVKTLVELTPSVLTMTPLPAIPMVSGKQTPPWQSPPRHECPQAPRFEGSDASATHVFEQAVVPLPQEMPHFIPSQVAVPLVTTGQAVHEVAPQLPTLVLERHAVPHKWKPVLQVNPHVVPLQIAVAFAGGVQGVQSVPQVETLVLDAQAPEQT
jgi:hypothetical protein